jgi:hypothetical protein
MLQTAHPTTSRCPPPWRRRVSAVHHGEHVPTSTVRGGIDMMVPLPTGLCGVRGGLKSGMDEPRRHLHGCAGGGLWRRQGGREEKWRRRWLGLGRRPSLVWHTLFGDRGSFIKQKLVLAGYNELMSFLKIGNLDFRN